MFIYKTSNSLHTQLIAKSQHAIKGSNQQSFAEEPVALTCGSMKEPSLIAAFLGTRHLLNQITFVLVLCMYEYNAVIIL
jgi:hypothetical protein